MRSRLLTRDRQARDAGQHLAGGAKDIRFRLGNVIHAIARAMTSMAAW
jgi:hypothetical protein